MTYFLSVADTQSITGAAVSLGITQSTISQSVQSLERELGTALFHRTGRGMALTSAGHALLGPARRILRETRQAEAAVAADPSRRMPRLDLAALSPALNGGFAEVLAAFLRKHPEAMVHVHELASEQEAVEVIASGTAEVVATRLPLQVGRAGTRLSTLLLGSYDVYVAYPPAGGRPDPDLGTPPKQAVEFPDLHEVPLVLMPPRPTLSSGMEAMLDENAPLLRRRAVVGRRETRTAWMLEGIAATLLGSRPAVLAAERGATLVPLREGKGLTVGLAWDPRTLSPVGRQFVAEAAAAVRSPAGHEPPETADPVGGPGPDDGAAAAPAT